MNWYVIRHPDTGGTGVVPESSLDIHRGLGWIRVSEAFSDMSKDFAIPADYADAPDLDAPAAKPVKPTTSKES